MVAINWLIFLLGLSIGILAATAGTVIYFQKGLSKQSKELEEKRKSVEAEAEQLIGDAKKAGESSKRELLLAAKEEVHNVKLDLEQEVRERRSEFQRERNRLDQKEQSLDRKMDTLEQKEEALDLRVCDVLAMEEHARELENQKTLELERISGLSIAEAQTQVLDQARQEYRHEMAIMLRQMEDEAKETANQKAKEIVVSAIQRYSADYVSEATVSVVNLPNEEMKGRIIGREGRNIRSIETLTGVDLIIDDTPEAVILSSFDPIRREIARIAIEKLVLDGRIHPARIEEMVAKAKREIDQAIKEAGEQAVFDTGIVGLHPEIIKLLGRMRYRTSYGQNVLKHSIEVCWLAGTMAAELDLDVMHAKRTGYFTISANRSILNRRLHITIGAILHVSIVKNHTLLMQ